MRIFGAVTVIFVIGTAIFFVGRRDTISAGQGDLNLPTRPVLVELFTSEGCSSCPPADALLAKLDQQQRLGNAEIIALEEHVDYWDQLGWPDPYSSSQWTQRQQDYAATFRNDGVYTPQMVVDGRIEFVGNSQSRARTAIAEAAREPKAEIGLTKQSDSNGKATISIAVKMPPQSEGQKTQVWLAVTESGLHSNVLQGENEGEDLHHAAVVRSLRKVGDAANSYSSEQDVRLDSGWKKENLRVVVFVQDPKSKHIVGAASLRLQP